MLTGLFRRVAGIFGAEGHGAVLDPADIQLDGPELQVLRDLHAQAKNGDPEAQYSLAVMYSNGIGMRQDAHLAGEWYLSAARQGHADAQYNLAVQYTLGEGVERDYQAAVAWYHKAAAQEHASAQNNLGIMYENGLGVETDDVVAETCFAHAARNGSDQALYNLGRRYMRAPGSNSSVIAYAFFSVAGAAGLDCRQELRRLRMQMPAPALAQARELAHRIHKSVFGTT